MVNPDKSERPPIAQPRTRKKRVAKVEEEPARKGKLVDPTLRKPAEKKPAAKKKLKAKASAK